MTDNKDFFDPNKEYKVQEESNFDVENGVSSDVLNNNFDENSKIKQNFNFLNLLNKYRRVFMPFILVFFIFFIYKSFIFISNYKNKLSAKNETLVAQKQAEIESKKTENSKKTLENRDNSMNDTHQQSVFKNMMINLSQQKIEKLLSALDDGGTKIERLNHQIDLLKIEIANFGQEVKKNSLLLDSVVQIWIKQNQLLEQQTKKKNLIKRNKKNILKKPKKQLLSKKNYHLKAIIPGRAWLETEKGETLDVKVGDEIDGYGSVQLISPNQGMVITSDGSVMQYGVNDF